ncbi:MAG: hypothetical protein ABJ004_15510 [Cyclobacteriaceae bacterium]
MKKSLTILLVLVLILPLPFSCGWYEGSPEYRIQRAGLEIGSIEENSDGNFYDFEIAKDTLSAADFGLRLFVDSISNVSSISHPNRLALFNAALADQPSPRPVSRLSLISIYSSTDLIVNEIEYKAGDNLAPVFLASMEYYYRQPQTVLSFIDSYFVWDQWNAIILHFNGELPFSVVGKFTVKATMSDGVVFELESEEVIIK